MNARRRRLAAKSKGVDVQVAGSGRLQAGADSNIHAADVPLNAASLKDLKSRSAVSRVFLGKSNINCDDQPQLGEVRTMFKNRMEALQREMEHQTDAALKELDASTARLKKRMKFEMQKCSEQAEEMTREARSFTGDTEEDQSDIRDAASQLISKIQTSGNSVSKGLSDLLGMYNKRLEELQIHYSRIF